MVSESIIEALRRIHQAIQKLLQLADLAIHSDVDIPRDLVRNEGPFDIQHLRGKTESDGHRND